MIEALLFLTKFDDYSSLLIVMSECFSSLFYFLFFYGVNDDCNADDLPCFDILPCAVTAAVGLLENEICEFVIEAGMTRSWREMD